MTNDMFGAPTPADIRLEDILDELRREIAMRERVYPRWVDEGKITEITATRRILILQAALERLTP